MKKIITIVVMLVVGGILFWLDSSNNNINLTKGELAVSDINLPVSSTTSTELRPARAIESTQATTETPPPPQSTQADFQLQPHEIVIVQEWADE